MENKLKDLTAKVHWVWKSVCILFGLYTIAISAILRANIYYGDDTGRALSGYNNWNTDGRYLSYIMAWGIHGDQYLTDISPLPQLIALFFLALTGVILLYLITGRKRYSFLELWATIPIALTPYFLNCLVYKYDSPYMALSVLASVIPLLFSRYGYKVYVPIIWGGVIAMCLTYQASSGIFPILVIFIALRRWNQGENGKGILRFILSSAAGYLAALAIYKIVIMKFFQGYRSTDMPGLRSIVPTFWKNIRQYYTYVFSDFKPLWIALILVLITAFWLLTVRDTARKRLPAALLTLGALGVSFLLAHGIYSVLTISFFSPRAMYGCGIIIAILCISIVSCPNILPKCAAITLCWFFFSFAFTYGNALHVQDEYSDFRIAQVIGDLNNLEPVETRRLIQLEGDVGLAPALRNMPDEYTLIKRMLPTKFSDTYWGAYSFFHYYDMKDYYSNVYAQEKLSEMNLPSLKDTMYHTIYGNDKYIFIQLK